MINTQATEQAKELPNVLKGKAWTEYLKANNLTGKGQMELYRFTHNYTACYKLGEYYFCFRIRRGYKNPAALKRLIA